MLLVQDEQVVQTLPAYATKEALAAGMFLGRPVGGADLFDTGGGGQSPEGRAKPAVVVADQVFGVPTKRM